MLEPGIYTARILAPTRCRSRPTLLWSACHGVAPVRYCRRRSRQASAWACWRARHPAPPPPWTRSMREAPSRLGRVCDVRDARHHFAGRLWCARGLDTPRMLLCDRGSRAASKLEQYFRSASGSEHPGSRVRHSIRRLSTGEQQSVDLTLSPFVSKIQSLPSVSKRTFSVPLNCVPPIQVGRRLSGGGSGLLCR